MTLSHVFDWMIANLTYQELSCPSSPVERVSFARIQLHMKHQTHTVTPTGVFNTFLAQTRKSGQNKGIQQTS